MDSLLYFQYCSYYIVTVIIKYELKIYIYNISQYICDMLFLDLF